MWDQHIWMLHPVKDLLSRFHATGIFLYPVKRTENFWLIFWCFKGVKHETSSMKRVAKLFHMSHSPNKAKVTTALNSLNSKKRQRSGKNLESELVPIYATKLSDQLLKLTAVLNAERWTSAIFLAVVWVRKVHLPLDKTGLIEPSKSDFHLPKNVCYLLDWKPFKNDKKWFYFILKTLFILKIFTFLSRLFGYVGKAAWLER